MSMLAPDRGAKRNELTRKAEQLTASALRSLKSPGQRAALRRGLGRSPEHPSVHPSHALVAPHLPATFDRATEWAFYTVAALIAAQPAQARNAETGEDDADRSVHAGFAESVEESEGDADTTVPVETDSPAPRRGPNLGTTLARAVASGKIAENTTEARLHLLCRQDLDGLHRHLPRMIAHLRAYLVSVDWVVLAVDLARWGTEHDRVAKEWLQAFHRTLARARHTSSTTGFSNTPESEDQ